MSLNVQSRLRHIRQYVSPSQLTLQQVTLLNPLEPNWLVSQRNVTMQDMVDPDERIPVIHIDQTLWTRKDFFCQGFVGADSLVGLVMSESGYVAPDENSLGKMVYRGSTFIGFLGWYDNDLRYWFIIPAGVTVNAGDTLTIPVTGAQGTVTQTFLHTGGGALQLGMGFETPWDNPRIIASRSWEGFGTIDVMWLNRAPGKIRLGELHFGRRMKIKVSNESGTPSTGENITYQAYGWNNNLCTYTLGTFVSRVVEGSDVYWIVDVIGQTPKAGVQIKGASSNATAVVVSSDNYVKLYYYNDAVKVQGEGLTIDKNLEVGQNLVISAGTAYINNLPDVSSNYALVWDASSKKIGKTTGLPPGAHAETHLPGGDDQLFDQSLNKSDDVTFKSVSIDSTSYKLYKHTDGTLRIQTPTDLGVVIEQHLNVGKSLAVTQNLGVGGQISFSSVPIDLSDLYMLTIGDDNHVGKQPIPPRIQYGTGTTNSDGEATVTFPVAFLSMPIVVIQSYDANGRGCIADVISRSTTGFTVKFKVLSLSSVAEAGGHTHGFPNTAAVDIAHSHILGNTPVSISGSTTSVNLSHTHGFPNTAAVDISHSHTLGSTLAYVGGETGSALGYHSHSVSVSVGSTDISHTHSCSTAYPHTHEIIMGSSSHCPYGDYYAVSPTQSAGEHNHSIGSGGGSHTHSTSASCSSVNLSHTHGFPNTAAVDISHSHTLGETLKYVGGSTGSALDSHSHGIDASVDIAHSHVLGETLRYIGGTTGEAGEHTHSMSLSGGVVLFGWVAFGVT